MPEVIFTGGKPRSTTVPLEWPVTVDGQEITAVTVSRLTGQQLADVAEEQGDNQALYALMTGLPIAVILALDAVDSQAVLEAAMAFLPRSMAATAAEATAEADRLAATADEPTGDRSSSTPPSSHPS